MKPLLALAALAVTLATSALADDFPARAVRVIVAYSAGGTADAAARLAVDPLGRQLGQSVYIENRPGSGGMTGTQAYFTLPPDGYTLLVIGPGTVAIIPAAKLVNFVTERDLVPLGGIWQSPQLLAVRTVVRPQDGPGIRRLRESQSRQDQHRLRRQRHPDTHVRRIAQARGRY